MATVNSGVGVSKGFVTTSTRGASVSSCPLWTVVFVVMNMAGAAPLPQSRTHAARPSSRTVPMAAWMREARRRT